MIQKSQKAQVTCAFCGYVNVVGCPPFPGRPSTASKLCTECRACHVVCARARLPRVLDSWKGRCFNTAAIGRELGVCRPTVVAYVRALEREGLIRLLPFYGGTRRPRFAGPKTELIIETLLRDLPGSRFSWWKTGRVRQVDLVAEIGADRIGFVFSNSLSPPRRECLALDIASRRGVIQRGYVLHAGSRAFFASARAHAVPLSAFVCDAEAWILRRQTPRQALEAMTRFNLSNLFDVA